MTLRPPDYRPRLLDDTLDRRLKGFGAVEVVGAKFCGKTWMSLAHGESIIHIDDNTERQIVELDAALALEGDKPHIIDEWQEVPKLWDAVRRSVDRSGNERGQFILTGSSTVDRSQVAHSCAGRIATLTLRPMSLFEMGASDGSVSLKGLFDGTVSAHRVETDVRALARLICQGGWPAALNDPEELLGDLPAQYLNALFGASAARTNVDGRIARRVAECLARNTTTTVTYKTLYADVMAKDISDKSDSLFYQRLHPFITFLKDQFAIEDLAGWDAPVKSRSRVRSKPKRTFVDPSLAASLLNMTPERLLHEMQIFGNLFEELCLRDVRVYASALQSTPEPRVCYYADSDGLEIDIIVELSDGRWGAFEVKLNEEKVPQAEKNLLRLKNKIAINPAARNREPSFLTVLLGKATFCRRLPSGVYAFPLTALTA